MFLPLFGCTHADTDASWQPPQGGEIFFETIDEVTIPATYLPASQSDRPAILLMSLHTGVCDDGRRLWPARLLDELSRRDWTVLVPDMRGCGAAEGDWRGLNGHAGIRDTKMYLTKMRDDGYGPMSIVTTGYIDAAVTGYMYQADRGQQDIVPVAINYLTSYGDHTEQMARIESLAVRPILFQYLTPNKSWPEDLATRNPGTWTFIEYEGNLLDTGLFTQNPHAIDDMVQFFDTVWPEEG